MEALEVLTSILRRPLLTAEQEIDLAKRSKQGDLEARHILAESNLKLVLNIAMKYNGPMSLAEKVAAGAGDEGLLKAVENFDPEMGHRFSTYATPWIRRGISRAIYLEQISRRGVKIPFHVNEQLKKLEELIGEDPALALEVDRVSTILGVRSNSAEALLSLRRDDRTPLSLDMPIGRNAAILADVISAPINTSPNDLKITLELAFERLNFRDQEILHLRFVEGLASEEIAHYYGDGMTKANATNLYRQALKRLKKLIDK